MATGKTRTEGPQDSAPDAVVIEPRGPARASVILLHGLGADGHDLAPAVSHVPVAPELGLRWILPHAAERSVGLAGGGRMRAWFDVAADDLRRGEATDLGGLKSADLLVRGLVEREIARGVPSNRIVIVCSGMPVSTAKPTIEPESRPAERNAPTGTSDTKWYRTDSRTPSAMIAARSSSL